MSFKLIPKSVSAKSVGRQLSAEQLKFYEDNGYLVIRGLFSPPVLDCYRQRFLDVCNGKIGDKLLTVLKDDSLHKPGVKPEDYINKIQELLYDEVFSTYSEDPRLLDIVSQLIGDNIAGVSLMVINKPPGSPSHPPHQDMLYMPFRPADKIVASWTAIDPVSKDNGVLYMVPGSHKVNMLLEHNDQAKDAFALFHGVVNWEAIASEQQRIYLEMRPGDTVLFHPHIVHGSLPNTAKAYRKAIVCHFANSACQVAEPAGSRQERLATQVENQLREKGAELRFTDFWRIKVKHVRGVKCNL